jgi:hypothetical protein
MIFAGLSGTPARMMVITMPFSPLSLIRPSVRTGTKKGAGTGGRSRTDSLPKSGKSRYRRCRRIFHHTRRDARRPAASDVAGDVVLHPTGGGGVYLIRRHTWRGRCGADRNRSHHRLKTRPSACILSGFRAVPEGDGSPGSLPRRCSGRRVAGGGSQPWYTVPHARGMRPTAARPCSGEKEG